MTDYQIPDSHRDLVDSATVALSTLNADGSIQTTAVWVLLDDDGLLRTSLAKNRKKYDNLSARPETTLFSVSPTNPFHTLEVRARAEIVDDDAQRSFMARLLATYGRVRCSVRRLLPRGVLPARSRRVRRR